MRLLCRPLHKLSAIFLSGALMGSKHFLKSALFSNPLSPPSHRRLSNAFKVPFYTFPSKPSSRIQPFCLLKANGYSNVSQANDPRTVPLEDSEEKNAYQLKILMQKLRELGLDTGTSMPGQFNSMLCPMCKGGDHEEKSLSLFIEPDGSCALWTCFRAKCGWKGSTRAFAGTQSSYETSNKSARVKQIREISVESLGLEPPCNELVAYFAERMISKETMQRNGIMQKNYGDQIAIAFTYWRNGNLISCKYRDINKKFWQEADTEKIFYGLDDIKEASDVIIVEGEMDKLALEEAGFRNCVSVPDGAPPSVSKKDLPPQEMIGRIPNEWARCLLPLVRDKKIKVEGSCKYAPEVLSIMDTIHLSLSVYINSYMLRKQHDASLKVASGTADESLVRPLPTLFRLLGLTPFKKAEFTPADLYSRKRPLDSKVGSGLHASLLLKKSKDPSKSDNEVANEESISDADVDNTIGVGDNSELEEMEPAGTLQCELRPYQKQALYWMSQLEKGQCMDGAATTLHPCWEAYHLADKGHVVYLNAFSGDATREFQSTLRMARGGILADAMGLGKTIMAIALLAHSARCRASGGQSSIQSSGEGTEVSTAPEKSPNLPKKTPKFSGFDKLMTQKSTVVDGGSLIVCPMTLLGQWKAEIETHIQPASFSLYVHYGQSRPKDAKVLAQSDIVLTTYGVLSSEFLTESAEDNGGLYSVCWFRVILDEAHTIKSSKSQISMAAAALVADRRWCLTGTPIQNNLEDVYSLLRFLRVEPWGNWAWWNKLIQKPFEEGDERGLKLLQSILKPIMLRRTKFSTDRDGRPILVLPPADVQVIYCELTEAEKDFYEALFKRSKVKFDQFVEQGRVLHNYASILELLLRLRQCCDHPFLVMSRGDTQEYSDLNKLARRFLKGSQNSVEGDGKDLPSRAYIHEVVEELRKGEEGECPVCLEAFEDAVLTPCAHRLCRECLLASWRNAASGLCPVCRKITNKQDLITAPTESRFQVDIDKNWVESTKVSVLLRELEALRISGSKSIVFSQWTAFLDILEIPLSRSNIQFLRLDGTLNQQQREKVIQQFSENSNILVLLMSLKAGGVGINLTAASSAFVLDPWWNPAVEEQAVMRIHRIGQTKNVMIKRFIVKGTVEEKMEAVQARKQRLISGALTDQEVRSARIEELKMLFA